MKKILKFIGLFSLFVMFLAACREAKLSFAKMELTISVGAEETLEVKVSDESLVLEWSSSDDKIVEVSQDGKVTGKAVGDATVTVKVKDKDIKATIKITVEAFDGTMSFDKTSIDIIIGESQKLSPVIIPAVGFELTWSSDKKSIAEVDSTGKVTAKSVGEALITVSGGGKNASITVNVIQPDPINIIITGAELIYKMGSSVQLNANVIPTLASQGVSWLSSDEEVATVTADGLVEFVGMGSVTITATSEAKASVTDSVTIQVIEPDPASIVITTETGESVVFLYGNLQLFAEVLPAEAQQAVNWGVSDPNIAIITEDGCLYGFTAGTVTVTATSNVDDEVFGTLDIIIYQPDPEEITVTGEYTIIQVDEELQLTTSVTPELASQDVLFESNNPNVAAVNAEGKVTGTGEGEAIITVKSAVLDTVTATYTVKVVAKSTSITHNRIIINPEYAELERFSEVKVDDVVFYVGINAFGAVNDVVVKEDAEIFFYPGTYVGNLIIDKDNVVLKSENSEVNPTESETAFKADSKTAAIIKGTWTVNANNITIKGFSFTEAARVKSYGTKVDDGFSNFLFENNYVYDTDTATIAWTEGGYGGSSDVNAAIPGFISLYPVDTYLHDFQFINNKFSNVSDTHIYMFINHGATIKGNVFSGGDRDVIRIESSLTYGDLTIEDNVFENIEYNGIFIRYPCGLSSLGDFYANIHGNTFKNIGSAGKTETPDRSRIGAIADPYTGEGKSIYYSIKFNVFENCVNYISLRDNVSKYETWKGKGLEREVVIEYNAFIDDGDVSFYFNNLYTKGDTPTANTGHVVVNHNFYGTSETDKAVINNTNNTDNNGEGQFGYRRDGTNNETVYDTYALLLAAIEALEQVE